MEHENVPAAEVDCLMCTVIQGAGGIFVSDDAGRSFARVGTEASSNCVPNTTPCDVVGPSMNNDFLSIAYDAGGGYLYAGGHINGIARKHNNDSSWAWINQGLLGPDLWQNETIVPDIQVDPDNGGGQPGNTGKVKQCP